MCKAHSGRYKQCDVTFADRGNWSPLTAGYAERPPLPIHLFPWLTNGYGYADTGTLLRYIVSLHGKLLPRAAINFFSAFTKQETIHIIFFRPNEILSAKNLHGNVFFHRRTSRRKCLNGNFWLGMLGKSAAVDPYNIMISRARSFLWQLFRLNYYLGMLFQWKRSFGVKRRVNRRVTGTKTKSKIVKLEAWKRHHCCVIGISTCNVDYNPESDILCLLSPERDSFFKIPTSWYLSSWLIGSKIVFEILRKTCYPINQSTDQSKGESTKMLMDFDLLYRVTNMVNDFERGRRIANCFALAS